MFHSTCKLSLSATQGLISKCPYPKQPTLNTGAARSLSSCHEQTLHKNNVAINEALDMISRAESQIANSIIVIKESKGLLDVLLPAEELQALIPETISSDVTPNSYEVIQNDVSNLDRLTLSDSRILDAINMITAAESQIADSVKVINDGKGIIDGLTAEVEPLEASKASSTDIHTEGIILGVVATEGVIAAKEAVMKSTVSETIVTEELARVETAAAVASEEIVAEPVVMEAVASEEILAEPVVLEAVASEEIVAEAAVLEVAASEEIVAEPVILEAVATEEIVAEPVVLETVASEEIVVEPVVMEAVAAEEIVAEPVVLEAVASEEIVAEPVVLEAMAAEEIMTEPVVLEAVASEEIVAEPVVLEAVASEKILAEPIVLEAVVSEEIVAEPVVLEAVASEEIVAEPVVLEAVASEEIVSEPVVLEAVAPEGIVAEPVILEAVASEEIVAEPFVLEAVASEEIMAEPAVQEEAVVEPAPAEEATLDELVAETVILEEIETILADTVVLEAAADIFSEAVPAAGETVSEEVILEPIAEENLATPSAQEMDAETIIIEADIAGTTADILEADFKEVSKDTVPVEDIAAVAAAAGLGVLTTDKFTTDETAKSDGAETISDDEIAMEELIPIPLLSDAQLAAVKASCAPYAPLGDKIGIPFSEYIALRSKLAEKKSGGLKYFVGGLVGYSSASYAMFPSLYAPDAAAVLGTMEPLTVVGGSVLTLAVLTALNGDRVKKMVTLGYYGSYKNAYKKRDVDFQRRVAHHQFTGKRKKGMMMSPQDITSLPQYKSWVRLQQQEKEKASQTFGKRLKAWFTWK